jgi:hypothetical protein
MPMTIDETVDALNDDLRRAGGPVKTYTWPDFYERCGVARFKQPRLDQIQEKASGKFGLMIAYGHNAVLVAHDRNFQP